MDNQRCPYCREETPEHNWAFQHPELIKALRAGKQQDDDGIMVAVSRQACEEAVMAIQFLQKENADLRAQNGGMEMEIKDLLHQREYLSGGTSSCRCSQCSTPSGGAEHGK